MMTPSSGMCLPSRHNDYINTRYTHRTKGSVVFASGSPYKPVEFEGKVYEPGQGNNMYIFPGLGLGAILSKARHVTDSMVEKASVALSASLTQQEKGAGLVYPRLVRIRDISAEIAFAVIRAAQKDNVDENAPLRGLSDSDLLEYVKSKQWQPPSSNHRPQRL